MNITNYYFCFCYYYCYYYYYYRHYHRHCYSTGNVNHQDSDKNTIIKE